MRALAFAAPLLALIAPLPAVADAHSDGFAGAARAVGNIVDLDGANIGSAVAVETESGYVLITVQAVGIPPGTHGVHLHEVGLCEGDFSSAGGHIAGDANHGLVEGGPHPGDLPNAYVGEDGELAMQAFNDRIEVTADLLDGDGAALIIHNGADDYISQPSGSAEARIACAVLDAVPADEEG
jgi:Cu-Zn family superoxide dismutase